MRQYQPFFQFHLPPFVNPRTPFHSTSGNVITDSKKIAFDSDPEQSVKQSLRIGKDLVVSGKDWRLSNKVTCIEECPNKASRRGFKRSTNSMLRHDIEKWEVV